jgi:hypothetical protein
MLKDSIHQEDTAIINICVPNITATKYVTRTLTHMEGEKQFYN